MYPTRVPRFALDLDKNPINSPNDEKVIAKSIKIGIDDIIEEIEKFPTINGRIIARIMNVTNTHIIPKTAFPRTIADLGIGETKISFMKLLSLS